MADFWSDYLKDEMLDHILGGSDYSRPSTVYFGVFTVAPTGVGGGTEVAVSRISQTNNATNFPTSSGQAKRNATAINWGTAGSDHGTMVGVGLFDASSSGNMLGYADFSTSITWNTGMTLNIPANSLEFYFD